MTKNNERILLIEKIIQFEATTYQLMREMGQFEWDYQGATALLDKKNLKDVLTRFINGNLSANDIYTWADFLEVRDDVDYPERSKEKISDIMNELADPIFEGKLTIEKAKEYITDLEQN